MKNGQRSVEPLPNFIYNELLNYSDVITPKERNGVKHVYHLYVVRLKNRDAIQAKLTKKGITTGIHYPTALPNLPAYRYLGYSPKDFPVASALSKEILSLPIYPEMKKDQVEYVCQHLKKAINR